MSAPALVHQASFWSRCQAQRPTTSTVWLSTAKPTLFRSGDDGPADIRLFSSIAVWQVRQMGELALVAVLPELSMLSEAMSGHGTRPFSPGGSPAR